MTDPITVTMDEEEWDVVIHALEEEMAQLEPMDDENWIGAYPGEEDAVAIGEVCETILESMNDATGEES